MKHGIIIACLIGLTAAVGVRAADETNSPPAGPHGPGRAMMVNILPPPVLDQLDLTSDQKTKYNDLNESFKKDAAKLRAANGQGGSTAGSGSTGTPPPDLRQSFRVLRKGYVEKVRAFLTDDQKTKLDGAMEHAPGHGAHGGPSGGGSTPPPPPSDK